MFQAVPRVKGFRANEFYLLGYNAVVIHRKSTDISEEHVASIFKVKDYQHETFRK
jgi:hypothetical protein